MNDQPQRRAADQVVAKLVSDMEEMKRELARNTEVTQQVRDLVSSFHIIAAMAKWLTVIVSMCVAFVALFKAGGGEIRFK